MVAGVSRGAAPRAVRREPEMLREPNGRGTEPGRILIAEDHLDSRDALQTLLEAFGYEVLVAANGREAVHVALTERPDLILMDIMMPELDGFQAIRMIREEAGTRMPIIAVTAMDGARDLSIRAGADDFISKPVDTRALLAKVRECLNQRS
jgi:DNA-binding response OmpR family regulator